jgi:hypothetical protein
MELSKLIEHLRKVDTIVDNRYADYRDTRDKYGDSIMLVDYYKQKYQKAKQYRESLKKKICQLEKSTKPKRKFIIDDEPQKITKPITPIETETCPSSQLYRPRKEVLTSAFGLRYRHDPDFREHVKNRRKERYERRKFLYV